MSVMYGKIRINGDAGQTITITTPTGLSKTVQTTGQEFTDIALAGMEEYTLSNGSMSEKVLLDIGGFQEVEMLARMLLKKLPYDFKQGSAVVLNGEIHILGGANSADRRKHYKFNGSSWVSVSTLPYDFYRGSAVVLNNEIHILGNQNANTNHYKWDGTNWSRVSTLPYSFGGEHKAVVLNNEIHIIGSTSINYTKHYKWDGSTWTSVSTLPVAGGEIVVLNNEIHSLFNASTPTSHYKWNGSSWSEVSTLPYSFSSDGVALVHNDEIHILSGESGNYTKHYKWNGTSWVSVSTLPYEFRSGDAVVWNDLQSDNIVILGTASSGYERYVAQYDGTTWIIGGDN